MEGFHNDWLKQKESILAHSEKLGKPVPEDC